MKLKNFDKLPLTGIINGKKLNLDKRQSNVTLPGIASKLLINQNFGQKAAHQEKKTSKSYSKEKRQTIIIPIQLNKPIYTLKISNPIEKKQRVRCVSQFKNYKINLKAENQYQKIKFRRRQSTKQQNSSTFQTTLKSKSSNCQEENSTFCKTAQLIPLQTIYFDNILSEIGLISQNSYKEQKSSENIKCENTKKSIPLIKKTYQSIGVSTDLEIHNESYKEFLKFKITQKQKFSKLQQIFQFIEDISVKQFPILNQRYKKVKKLYEESQETERQKRTIQLKKQIKEFQSQFQKKFQIFSQSIISFQNKVLQRNFSQINRIKDFIIKISKQNNSQTLQMNETKNQKCDSKVKNFDGQINQLKNEQDININQKNKKQKNKKNSCYSKQNHNRNFLLHEAVNIIANVEGVKFKIQQQMQEQVVVRFNQLYDSFKTWSQAQNQKNYLIKVCVQDIVKLPQMSLSIFGMSNDEETIEQMSALKKIGIMLDQIPHFDNFCSSKPDKLENNQIIHSMMNVKCLNCAYLKSKMKFIYSKNSQIQPTLKVLNHLADTQKHNYY